MFVGKQRLGDRAADIEGQAVFRQAVETIDAFDAIHLADTGVVPDCGGSACMKAGSASFLPIAC